MMLSGSGSDPSALRLFGRGRLNGQHSCGNAPEGLRRVAAYRRASVDELRQQLKGTNQLWIISNSTQRLTAQHIAVVKDFFDEGRGV